jgi:hypothetical protein
MSSVDHLTSKDSVEDINSEDAYDQIIKHLKIIKSNNDLPLISKIKQYIEKMESENLDEISCIVKDISTYIEADARNVIKGRRSPFPERISENIAKLCLQKQGENVAKGKTGDLCTNKGYKFEVKCFSSGGPISFGPCCTWNELIFVDLIDYKNYNVKVYRTKLTNDCAQWNEVNMSKTQTFKHQKIMKRRPRIGFKSLYPQIKEFTTLLYEGKIQYLDN